MPIILAIATREFRSFFRLPVGWIVIALYLLLTGVIFAVAALVPGEPATLRGFFVASGFLMLPIAPAISMRLLSEEFRSGTAEPLMTSPVSDGSIVLGKYFGAAAFLIAMHVPTLVYPAVLLSVSEPAADPGPIAAGYLSLLLLGLLYLSIGTLASALTANQVLAFIGTLLFLMIAHLVTSDAVTPALPDAVSQVVMRFSLTQRLDAFARGLIDTGNVAFFLGVSAWFVVLASVALESRRWR
jgi:ABC-2 type transport system permease protein